MRVRRGKAGQKNILQCRSEGIKDEPEVGSVQIARELRPEKFLRIA